MLKKVLILVVILFVVGGLVVGVLFRQWIWGSNINPALKTDTFYVPTGSSAEDVFELLKKEKVLKNYISFSWVAKVMHYDKNKVPPGKYTLDPEMSNRQLVSMLRTGKQTPVNITYNNVRYVEELAGKIARYIEEDSLEIVKLLQDQAFCEQRGLDTNSIMTLFIPNTYEFYWNTRAIQVVRRMEKEHAKFWQAENRLEKATELGLTPAEVFTLASIVEKETLVAKEKPRVAGVYLNRLKKNMLLQADPTVVYANGDFELRRVLNKHLEIDSPYNTYKFRGLPPGPICMPDVSTIDAVLNAEDHDYIYFCAKPKGKGRHAFAKTLRQHMKNARAYQEWYRNR